MNTVDKLIEAYIATGEKLHKAERELEEAFKKAKESLPERAAYRKAEDALKQFPDVLPVNK